MTNTLAADHVSADGLVPVMDHERIELLRADLTAADWSPRTVTTLLGYSAEAALAREQRLPALRVLRDQSSPAAILTRLFLLGEVLEATEAEVAFPTLGLGGARKLHLITDVLTDVLALAQVPDTEEVLDQVNEPELELPPEIQEVVAEIEAEVEAAEAATQPVPIVEIPEEIVARVQALVSLRPVTLPAGKDCWVAADLGEAMTGRGIATDHVLGLGGASQSLLLFTNRQPRERLLDLGTGCGIQALQGTDHAQTVVGTDINPRALGFAAFNACLAGRELDLRLGSLFEPVAEETFDQVISNPPFVITPEELRGDALFTYRDGASQGDGIVAQLVQEVAGRLRPGGIAQLLGNWEIRGQWWQRPQEWLAGTGLDGWVVLREVIEPARYAEIWLRDGGVDPRVDREAYEAALETWVEYFERRAVTAIGFGYFALRRPFTSGGSGLHWFEDGTSALEGPTGTEAERVLNVLDFLRSHGLTGPGEPVAATVVEQEFGPLRLQLNPQVVEERHHRPGEGEPYDIHLVLSEPRERRVSVSAALAGVVGACDGELTVEQIVTAVAALLAADRTQLWTEVAEPLRDLLCQGLLQIA